MKTENRFVPELISSPDLFLSDAPMTDEAFEVFVKIENGEIPVERVDFSKPLYTSFEI